jgi:hypothetical protein
MSAGAGSGAFLSSMQGCQPDAVAFLTGRPNGKWKFMVGNAFTLAIANVSDEKSPAIARSC